MSSSVFEEECFSSKVIVNFLKKECKLDFGIHFIDVAFIA